MWDLTHSESKLERGSKHMFFSSLLTSPTVDFNHTEQGVITIKFDTARIHFSHVCVVVTKSLCERFLARTTRRQREISKKRKAFYKETTFLSFLFFLYFDAVSRIEQQENSPTRPPCKPVEIIAMEFGK